MERYPLRPHHGEGGGGGVDLSLQKIPPDDVYSVELFTQTPVFSIDISTLYSNDGAFSLLLTGLGSVAATPPYQDFARVTPNGD